MKKVEGYDDAQILTGEYENLEAGGYICKILDTKEKTSSTGKKMLSIVFDIAEGEHKDFYKRKFDNDTRIDKKWPTNGVYRQMLEGDKAAGYLKGLITSLEASNPKFKWEWDETKLKGLLFGGIFRREQYEANDGSLKFSTKLQFIRSVEKIKNGEFEVPSDKLLPSKVDNAWTITEEDVNDLPF